VAAFFASDQFITGLVYGLIIAMIFVIPAELLAEWWRKR
jgi:hypothetical protein